MHMCPSAHESWRDLDSADSVVQLHRWSQAGQDHHEDAGLAKGWVGREGEGRGGRTIVEIVAPLCRRKPRGNPSPRAS